MGGGGRTIKSLLRREVEARGDVLSVKFDYDLAVSNFSCLSLTTLFHKLPFTLVAC